MKIKITLISVFCCLFFMTVNAQKYKGQRFKIGVIAGVNMAQVDGDRIFGYNQPGVQVGLQGITILTKKQYLSTGLLFSQRGAVTDSDIVRFHKMAYTNIRENYIEIPFLINREVSFPSKNPWSFSLYTGFSVGRLLSVKITGVDHPSIANPVIKLQNRSSDFKTFEIAYIFGGTFFFNENFGLTLRHTLALTTFFEPTATDVLLLDLKPMRNYFFTAGGVYIFN